MNNSAKIWKFVSKQLNLAQNSAQEKTYQDEIFDVITDIDLLGWPSNRVIREYPIQMGSTKKSDIVLLDSENNPIIAIEVKLANSPSDGVEQLGSYMDRCEPRLTFGLTIKNSIDLFYDENTGRSIHSTNDAVLSASFNNQIDLDGIRIIELLSFQNFNIERLRSFCKEQQEQKVKERARKAKTEQIRELLFGNSGKEILQKAICQYLTNQGIITPDEEDIVKECTGDIAFRKTSETVSPEHLISQSRQIQTQSRSKIKYIPSLESFIEHLKLNIGYRHFILADGTVETKPWNSSGGIDASNIQRNILSHHFYRNNKHKIVEIIISEYNDPYKR